MKQAVKWGNSISYVLVTLSAALALAGCQSMVKSSLKTGTNIQTIAYENAMSLTPAKFNPQVHTIYVSDKSLSETPQRLIGDMLKKQGIKTVNDKESADYKLRVTAFVTMPYKADTALPFSAEYLLSLKELPIIKPLLILSDDVPGEQMKKMGELVRKSSQGIMGSDTSNVIALGSTFGGNLGGIAAGAAAGLVDVAGEIVSQNSIREGLAGFNFSLVGVKGVFNPFLSLNVYAASTSPENPESLLKAAIERAVSEMVKE